MVEEANAGNWDGEKLGEALCKLDSHNRLKLATVDEELQKQLANLNKTKACLSVPLLGSGMQQWMFQEALEGRWDPNLVFRVLKETDSDKGKFITAMAPSGIIVREHLIYKPRQYVSKVDKFLNLITIYRMVFY